MEVVSVLEFSAAYFQVNPYMDAANVSAIGKAEMPSAGPEVEHSTSHHS